MAEEYNIEKCNEDAMGEGSISKINNESLSGRNHILRKNRPPGFIKKKRKHIYVSKKASFKSQLVKCEKLLDTGASEIIIHGLGAAVSRTCSLALCLKESRCGIIDLDIKTSTVHLIDDLEPLSDNADYEIRHRNNSSIHIRIFRKTLMGTINNAQSSTTL